MTRYSAGAAVLLAMVAIAFGDCGGSQNCQVTSLGPSCVSGKVDANNRPPGPGEGVRATGQYWVYEGDCPNNPDDCAAQLAPTDDESLKSPVTKPDRHERLMRGPSTYRDSARGPLKVNGRLALALIRALDSPPVKWRSHARSPTSSKGPENRAAGGLREKALEIHRPFTPVTPRSTSRAAWHEHSILGRTDAAVTRRLVWTSCASGLPHTSTLSRVPW
jgi:hypothetical protein